MSIYTREPGDVGEEAAERLRSVIEDAVARALEAGWNAEQVRVEVTYALESYEA